MYHASIAAFLTISASILTASASPLDRRQDASSSLPAPTAGLIVVTNSDGTPTTILQAAPSQLAETTAATATIASTTVDVDSPASTAEASAPPSSTNDPVPSKDFPLCTDANAKPFCFPSQDQKLYVDETYYITWNPDFFKHNTTIKIDMKYDNSSNTQVWTSGEMDVSRGVSTVTMVKDWLQGGTYQNITLVALNFDPNDPDSSTTPYDGPRIMLSYKPAQHLPPSSSSSYNKSGLLIGLPVGLGALMVVLFGLYFGMKKQREIGLGNIMGRKRGYGVGKSRRQRLGLGKKGAIRLEQRELDSNPRQPQAGYQDDSITPAPLSMPSHSRDISLGSLVDDDERPRQNAFREEMERQRTGR